MTDRARNKSKLRYIPYLGVTAVISCASACQTNQPNPSVPQATIVHKEKVQPQVVMAPQRILPTQLHQLTHNNIKFHLVTFDMRNQHIDIADQVDGPGSQWSTASAAAKENNGIAAINAGFFTPEGKPLGIVISNGTKRGSYNRSSLGSGLFYNTPDGAKISRRSAWAKLARNPPEHLLQSGPMLLENSKPISGLSSKNPRPRSFIATDGKNHWCIGHADSCTLSQLSEALGSLEINQFKATTALNLDGGRSSDLWISELITGGSKNIRPFWNKPVRNFLILKKN